MVIAEWIIYVMIFCFCVASLGVGSVLLVITVNVITDRKAFNERSH